MVVRSKVRADSRVLRIGNAIAAAGHDVSCVGYLADGELPAFALDEVDGSSLAGLRRLEHAVLLPLARVRTGWRAAYWSDHRVRALHRAVHLHRPDVIHAHDWDTLPIAMRVADDLGSTVVYDSHELATEEYADSRAWSTMYLPFTRAIEEQFIRRAAAVITVSDSIADQLKTKYRLAARPIVVRNVPDTAQFPPRPLGDVIEVLYHGGITRHRGLVEAAESTHRWPDGYRLTVRGDAPAELLAEIRAAAAPGRLRTVPAVQPADVVREANLFDIGLHPSVGFAKNDEYSLPNKFFEYMNAGLALCIADLPEMARLVRDHELGALISRPVTPASIASAVATMHPARIWAAKQASARLASTLTWQREASQVVELYEGLASR